MAETAQDAPQQAKTEVWHVDFHLSFEPDSLSPHYIKCDVSRREPGDNPNPWHIDGIASFEAPALIPPRAGAELIPYLVYHIDEIKMWLTEEHVRRVFNGTTELISEGAAGKPVPSKLHSV